MLNSPPPRITPVNRRMQEIILSQEEFNEMIRNIPQEKLLNEVELAIRNYIFASILL